MVAVELDAFPGDRALVIRVMQHLAEFLGAERPGGSLGSGSLSQSADLQFGGQLAQRPVAGRVGVERPADVGGAVGIGLDGADFDTAHHVPDIEVADRGQSPGELPATPIPQTRHARQARR